MSDEQPADQSDLSSSIETFINCDVNEIPRLFDQNPIWETDAFDEAIQRLSAHAAASGDSDAVLRIQERHEILEERRNPAARDPAPQAVEAFINAWDEEEARSLFSAQQTILCSSEARELMESLTADDADTATYLDERRALYRTLVAAEED